MKKIIVTVIFIILIILGYSLGRVVSRKEVKRIRPDEVFIATITDINNESIMVKGIEENAKDYRRLFELKLTNTIKYNWKDKEITFNHLNIGDNIKITFNGELKEIYPVIIDSVKTIELLENNIRRLINIDNQLYYDTKVISSVGARPDILDGYFFKDVNEEEIPVNNNTSNFGDYSYQKSNKENIIDVYIDNKWIEFKRK